MLGVMRGKTSPRTDLVVKVFVANGEKGIRCNRETVV